jgi:hypothetical protein
MSRSAIVGGSQKNESTVDTNSLCESHHWASANYLQDVVISPLRIAHGLELFSNTIELAAEHVKGGRLKSLSELEQFLLDEAKVCKSPKIQTVAHSS